MVSGDIITYGVLATLVSLMGENYDDVIDLSIDLTLTLIAAHGSSASSRYSFKNMFETVNDSRLSASRLRICSSDGSLANHENLILQ